MDDNKLPEVWQRGPTAGVPALLQPVAHALLQADEEITALMADFQNNMLYEKPAGLASPAFHLQHLTGVLDRLLTYARAEMLSPEQLNYLANEGKVAEKAYTATQLAAAFSSQVQKAIHQIKHTDESTLTDGRGVGRAQIPSTVIGLLVHAAEHTMRHTGQLLVTVKILQASL
ncbi:DinB family protein [Mucilaginibacter sp. JRF]|uniref:DinB family protein n=1 Tax=Mucilaginibacter sp. JRF TaxID=2780088 RepID=UPI00187E99B2|nr:DinB family protein [Mucilaginibacter sp. JRF]MBE9585188.1 DinB family protein [Mucilaginibacter sp. JRF]